MAEEVNGAVLVPRSRVFVTVDGLFVVHWEENRVQDLLSGRYLPYSDKQFDAPVTDWELQQLRNRGVVEAFDDAFVHLQRVPEWQQGGIQRSYYLYTRIPKHRLRDVENRLAAAGLSHRFGVRARDQFLVIRGVKGTAFADEEAAEAAQRELSEALPDLFKDSVIAFVDVVAAE